jgi:AP2-like factor, ANT lineage
MTNNNGSNNGDSGSNIGGSNAAASGWLGFSLSPHMAPSMDDDNHHHVQAVQQQHHGGIFFPSVTAVSAASAPYYTPQLASMPLKSDGSLCIMEALRRTDQQDHHGTVFLLDCTLALVCFLEYWIVIYIFIM